MRTVVTAFFLSVLTTVQAAPECPPLAAGQKASVHCAKTSAGNLHGDAVLPAAAVAQVQELEVRMRFFMSVGLQKESKKKRNAIAAIYQEHSLPIPAAYQD